MELTPTLLVMVLKCVEMGMLVSMLGGKLMTRVQWHSRRFFLALRQTLIGFRTMGVLEKFYVRWV